MDTNQPRHVEEMHPAVQEILRFFEYEHLPTGLQHTSRPFHELAHSLAGYLEGGAPSSPCPCESCSRPRTPQ